MCGFVQRETSCGPKGFEWKESAKENAVGGRVVGGGEERRNGQVTSGRLGERAAQPQARKAVCGGGARVCKATQRGDDKGEDHGDETRL